ncbi:MAG TPA: HAD-IC family P-type ATPase, partial [Chitinophagaceae bacterium]|nr:HAD-IC family P-type ATPase [Chitinophagaceae bacterium]
PVAFTTFMALGSWRLMKQGIIVKRTRTVETLGSATVICSDKTGTITENKMVLQAVYAFSNRVIYQADNWNHDAARQVIRMSMWATAEKDERRSYTMVYEYPLDGKPPMMTHIFNGVNGERIIAAKGATEAILVVSRLSDAEKNEIKKVEAGLAEKGYRVLGVASSSFSGDNFPAQQQSLSFDFSGLVIFYDPPKANIQEVFNQFYDAGIDVKVFTGDNEITTMAIAKFAGIRNASTAINGEALMELDEPNMIRQLHDNAIFTRMFPEAKLAAVNALKKDNQVVAMIGDGVNDGPALKAAHIGIAMGQKGTEIAKSAAALILVNDDLSKMVEAVAAGRRIYT